ncbi:MAG: hypothetical protein ACP5J4_12470 [Anaerolineae bacterium]
MVAEDEHVRLSAYWQHYKTHFQVYTKWAAKCHLVDATSRSSEEWERAENSVTKVFNGFYRAVLEGRYNPDRALPCTYIKRSIVNQFQDLARRGTHLTQQECLSCWESNHGSCPHFKSEHPWTDVYAHCHHPLAVTGLEEFTPEDSAFAAAGLQEQWPPVLTKAYATPSLSRPVEDMALHYTMVDYIDRLMLELLKHNQYIVLVETFINHKTSREIALIIDTTPGNVDQLRRRALKKLYRALTH